MSRIDPPSGGVPPGGSLGRHLEAPLFTSCVDGTLPEDLPYDVSNHTKSALLILAGERHFVEDAIVRPGETVLVSGKMSYGPTNDDLEEEWVSLRLDDCSGTLAYLGRALTDRQGWVTFELDDGRRSEPWSPHRREAGSAAREPARAGRVEPLRGERGATLARWG